jgi:hypothetical protein
MLPTTRCISSSPFTKPSSRKRRKFVPRKAAVELTEQARTFFKALLENNPQKDGIILNYQQASSGQPRMVFSFGFVSKDQLTDDDEGYVDRGSTLNSHMVWIVVGRLTIFVF